MKHNCRCTSLGALHTIVSKMPYRLHIMQRTQSLNLFLGRLDFAYAIVSWHASYNEDVTPEELSCVIS
jgi:hypothetical protein